MIALLASACEIAVFFSTALILFRRSDQPTAEAVAYAIVTVFMVFSFLFQAAFIIGYPFASLIIEGLLFTWALAIIYKNRGYLKSAWEDLRRIFFKQPVAVFILSIAFCFLLFNALVALPDSSQWPSIDRMTALDCQKNPFRISAGDETFSGAAPLNVDVLPYLLVRWDSIQGVGLFGFLAYACIGFSTYALARRYAWPPTSMCVTVVMLSFPRFLYHAVSPGDEIVPAAVAVFCILAAYRLVERLRFSDLVFIILGIFFQISNRAIAPAFPLLIAALTFIVNYQRHGILPFKELLFQNRVAAILCLIPMALFSQVWLFAFNLFNGYPWDGSFGWEYHSDGIMGAVANLCRYAIQSLRLPASLEVFLDRIGHFSWTDFLLYLNGTWIEPLFGARGAVLPFSLPEFRDASTEGFGLFGVLLMWPGLMYAIFRGPRRLKAIARGLLTYVFVVSLIMAWRPENASLFSSFYACGGFCMAFILPPWRLTYAGKLALQVASGLLIAATFLRF